MTESTNSQDSKFEDDEINLLDLAIILAKHKKMVLGFPFVVALLAAGISLLLPNVYTGVTRILPPLQSQSSAQAMLTQLGGLAGLAGGVVGIKNPNDIYVGMLKSRTVADNLIRKFDLNAVYGEKYQSNTRKDLEKVTRITAAKDGIITIAVDDKDPKRAADLANGYVDELLKLTQVLAVTEAAQRRLFFERQLAQAKDSMTKAELSARKALAHGGLVKVDDQGKALIEATARLRAQITVKQVQIGAMRAYATEDNPELQLAQQELQSLKLELAKIEGTGGGRSATIGQGVGGIDNLTLLRDVKYKEALFDLLTKQYEIAKIDEAKDSAVIQVMDKAIQPDRKSKPYRALIVILSALVAGLLAVMLAFAKEAIERARTDPEQSIKLQIFLRHLTGK